MIEVSIFVTAPLKQWKHGNNVRSHKNSRLLLCAMF